VLTEPSRIEDLVSIIVLVVFQEFPSASHRKLTPSKYINVNKPTIHQLYIMGSIIICYYYLP